MISVLGITLVGESMNDLNDPRLRIGDVRSGPHQWEVRTPDDIRSDFQQGCKCESSIWM